ncbi:MAG TPA: hypothetical protein VNN73_20835 [Blastocatellia bacterium]|nr:hypothetical protein [Blastocatellia bacterium]
MKAKRLFARKHKSHSGRVIKVARKETDLTRINEHASGIDIGSESHFVAVPPDSCADPVRQFGVFTKDLYQIADGLQRSAAAVTATGHKLARIYYRLVKHGEEYVEVGARAYEEKHRERVVSNLRKRARGLGYELVAAA